MTHALAGQWEHLGWVATKAALLFLVAVVGLRLSARRTLAELSVYDFVTAVAVGAVVGRVPNASTTSFVSGAVTLVVLLAMHRILGTIRLSGRAARILDHEPAVLVSNGSVDKAALRRVQLTGEDLASMLRSRGVGDLADVHCVIFEPGGALTVAGPEQAGGGLVAAVVAARSSDRAGP